MGWHRIVVILIATVICYVQAGHVSSINPTKGSLAGGTRLTLYGSGFARDQFNFLDTPDVGNEVLLVTKTTTYICDIHKDGCTMEQLMCYTRPMPAGDYYVRVTVDGRRFDDDEYYADDPWHKRMKFQVHASYTPIIKSVSPMSDIPEQLIRLEGKIITDRYGSNVGVSSNGKTVSLRRAYIGSSKFDLINPDNVDLPDVRDEYYGFQVEPDSNEGNMTGKNTDSYVGNLNISFILDGEYGRSHYDKKRLTAGKSGGKLTMYQTYAVVNSVSPTVGSTVGKTKLSIVGKYFDETDADAEVTVAGTPCAVESVTDELIVCSTAPEPSPMPTELLGNRGLAVDIWTGSDQYAADLSTIGSFPAPDETTWIDWSAFAEQNDTRDEFVYRIKGSFMPPSDGDYKLLIKGTDEGQISFNDGSSTSVVASFSSKKTGYWEDIDQASDRLTLTKDVPYYLEAIGKGGTGLSSLTVGAFMYDTVYTPTHTSNAEAETQKVEITSDVIKEKQTIAFTHFTSQPSALVNEVQSLEIDSAGLLSGATFRITLAGVSTTELTIDSSEEDVAGAIGSLPNVSPDTVTVAKTQTASGVTYSVEFNSEKGTWPDLSADVTSNDATVTTTKTTEGVPALNSYYLHFDGDLAGPISLDASAGDVKSALLEAKSVRCPSWLDSPQSKTFGTGGESPMAFMQLGSLTSDVMPFCGSKSIKNTQFLLLLTWNDPSSARIAASTSRYVCFAFNGKFHDQIGIHYNYTTNGQRLRRAAAHTFSDQPFGEYDVWKYRCIDVYQTILDMHSGVAISDIQIWYIKLYPFDMSKDWFIDTISIGSAEVLAEDQVAHVNKMILRPSRWSVKDVAVTGDFASSYAVEITARDCADDFPFIKVHGGTASESGSTSTITSTNWPSAAQVEVTRVATASPPVTGTFSLDYDGETVSGLRAGMSAESFKAKLESLSNMKGMGVTFDGHCSAGTWTVKWLTHAGDHPEMTVNDASGLVGDNVAVAVTTEQDGGLYLDPIPGDMFQTKHTNAQVVVVINNIISKCTGSCGFEWHSSATPTLTAVSPTSGSAGTTLTLTGTGFSTTAAENQVLVGDTECVGTTSTGTQLECTLGEGAAGLHDVVVNVLTKGEADKGGATIQFTSSFSVTSFSPSSGALGGGTSLTLTGVGFGSGVTVTVGGNACVVMSSSYDTIVCLTPAGTAGAADVQASDGTNSHTASSQYNYDSVTTPTITSLTPDAVGLVQGGKEITITGTGFGTSASVLHPVRVNGKPAPHSTYGDTEIKVVLPANPPGTYPLVVSTAVGNATGSADITYTLRVDNVYPTSGSQDGGTDITITGEGFSTNKEENLIHFGTAKCEVLSATTTQVVCRSGTAGNEIKVTNLGVHPEYYLGYAFDPSEKTIQMGDTLHWEWTTPPYVEGVAYGVYQTEEADSMEPLPNGFGTGSNTPRGSYRKTFMTPGTFYYYSKPVDANGLVILRGKVIVMERTSSINALNYTIAGSEAIYDTTSGVSDPTNSDSCSPTTSAIAGCTDPEPTASDSSKFHLSNWACKTPSISSIEPLNGTASTVVTITGTGFSTIDCQNEVMMGSNPCTVASSTATEITCNVAPVDDALVGTFEQISVRVKNIGYGLSTAPGGRSSLFLLLPNIASVTPSSGSTAGGTKITISGKGFRSGHTRVLIDGADCDITSQDYSTIVCTTPANSAGTAASISVQVNNDVQDVPATCEDTSTSCQFTYDSSKTPTVSDVANVPIIAALQTVTITGTGFGSDADTTVKIGDTDCSITSISSTSIQCNAGTPIVGSQAFTVHVEPDGLASSSVAFVSVEAIAPTLSPSTGSLGGGTILTVTGFGFFMVTQVLLLEAVHVSCPLCCLT